MKRVLLVAALALGACVVQAQSALPVLKPGEPGSLHQMVTKNGACAWYYIYHDTFDKYPTGVELALWCAAPTEFTKIGGRVATIVGATDSLRSLQTLKNRIAMSTITCPAGVCASPDPALAPILADFNALP